MNAHVSLKVAIKGCFGGKKVKTKHFWGYYSKAKTDEWDQKTLIVFDKFETIISCSATNILEISAHVLHQVETKCYTWG